MPTTDELNITVKLDTQAARRELAELKEQAMATLREIIESYAAIGLTPGQTTNPANNEGGARRV
jgi:hypothetical protein